MANPLNVLNGAPVIITAQMVNAFNDVRLKAEGVPGLVTLWDLFDYLGRNTGGSAIELDDLADVEFKNPPTNGQGLIYNSGDGVWENADLQQDMVPWTDVETTDLSADAQSKGLQVVGLRFRVTADRMLHLIGRINFGVSPQVGGDTFLLFDAGYFPGFGVTPSNGFGNGGVFFDIDGVGRARLTSGNSCVISNNAPAAGFCDINAVMRIDD